MQAKPGTERRQNKKGNTSYIHPRCENNKEALSFATLSFRNDKHKPRYFGLIVSYILHCVYVVDALNQSV